MLPRQPIALILHTPGGLVLATSQVAMALRKHPGRKVVNKPHYAMSRGTLITLVADEIIMNPDAVLGPLDSQIHVGNKVYSAPSLVKTAKLKGRDAGDDMMVLDNVAEKAVEELQGLIDKLLEDS
jgi:ClpP class serine protease